MSKRVRNLVLKTQAVLNRYCSEQTCHTNQGLKALSEEALYKELMILVEKLTKFRALVLSKQSEIDPETLATIKNEFNLLDYLIEKVNKLALRPPK